MDYAAEQEMELEALEAIFMDDMQESDDQLPDGWSRHGKTYCVLITPSDEADSSGPQAEVAMELLFAHTPTYPDKAPSFRLRSVQGLSDTDIAAATSLLKEQVEANLGMAMIYTLFSAAQEWLTARAAEVPSAAPGGNDPDAERRRAEEAAEAVRVAARSHGTPVTVEAFMEWKRRFDAEQALQKASLDKKAGADGPDGKPGVVRLTGKQWFLQHAAEAADDGSQLEEGEEDGLSDDDGAGGDDEDEDEDDSDYEDYDDDDDDEEGMLEELVKR